MDNFDWTSILCYDSLALIMFVLMVPDFIFVFMIGKKREINNPSAITAGFWHLRLSSPCGYWARRAGAGMGRTRLPWQVVPEWYKVENYEMVNEYGKKIWV